MSELQENICQQCGGVLKVEYTMIFEQCLPSAMCLDPILPVGKRLCPGHPAMSEKSDWEQLTNAQKWAVDRLVSRVNNHFIAEIEAFYKQHPELRLIWQFTIDALIRDNHE